MTRALKVAPLPVGRAPRRRRLPNRATQPEGVRVTSLFMPRRLHERARIAAIRLNWSYAELIRTALVGWLDAHESTASRKETTR